MSRMYGIYIGIKKILLCVLCVLFCAASKTIRCSGVSPYLIFENENYEVCFLVGSYLRQSNYGRKKRYSRPAIGWNKSQITVCRVKI